MKKLVITLSSIAAVLATLLIAYAIYKKFFCKCNSEEEVEEIESETAPHSRGYFNLNKVKEAATQEEEESEN